ncbi:MAG: MOSC domain-containing protein [Terrimicrobiaceae bacterium]|nr:MOSC domain-containing protein [Terrimicrobiaceae bacterium]
MPATLSEVGSVAALHRYPIKSMMGEELNATMIGSKGLIGDRLFAIVDPATGKIASAKNPSKWPNLFAYRAAYTAPLDTPSRIPPVRITLPDGDTVLTGDEKLDAVLSGSLGKPVRFLSAAPASGTLEEYWPDVEGLARRDEVTDEAMPTGTFFDLAMLHLLTTATIDELRRLYPVGRVEPRRFRPNIVIATPPDRTGFVEADWVDQILSIGEEVKLKITGPCPRCIMTTLPQGDLPRDTGILKTAVRHNDAQVGVYASVLSGGVVRVGDLVCLE